MEAVVKASNAESVGGRTMSRNLLGRVAPDLERRRLLRLTMKLCIRLLSHEAYTGITSQSCLTRFVSGEFDAKIEDAVNPLEVGRYCPWVPEALTQKEELEEQILLFESIQMAASAEHAARRAAQDALEDVENEAVEAADRKRRRMDE